MNKLNNIDFTMTTLYVLFCVFIIVRRSELVSLEFKVDFEGLCRTLDLV